MFFKIGKKHLETLTKVFFSFALLYQRHLFSLTVYLFFELGYAWFLKIIRQKITHQLIL